MASTLKHLLQRFTFRALPAGVYTLEGRVDSFEFVLPPIRVE